MSAGEASANFEIDAIWEDYMKLRTVLFAGAALFATQFAPAIADDKVSLMVGGYAKQIYLSSKLTEALGYFKDEGLDVELLNAPAGVDAAAQR